MRSSVDPPGWYFGCRGGVEEGWALLVLLPSPRSLVLAAQDARSFAVDFTFACLLRGPLLKLNLPQSLTHSNKPTMSGSALGYLALLILRWAERTRADWRASTTRPMASDDEWC
ncbi:hypothetical protein EXIGLDRAFT_766215 [Exidia glandulosa HHB12029]|uniref:Uncharacterized protein n=1 Tax=Exidia glandulosa HHB12029 TaxID=1314781 RepID=A0A165JVS1_EXIGL|nr:hypothetical protein EXIGLDRAFT_766215 [Exidia glandulosa HHB12029]